MFARHLSRASHTSSPVLPTRSRTAQQRRRRNVVGGSKFSHCVRSLGNRRNVILYLVFALAIAVVVSTLVLKGRISEATSIKVAGSPRVNRVVASSGTLATSDEDHGNDGSSDTDGQGGTQARLPSHRSELKQLLVEKKRKRAEQARDGYRPAGRPLHSGEVLQNSRSADDGFLKVRALLDHADPLQNNNARNSKAARPEIPAWPHPTPTTPKVFGIGLSKTGTSSLASGLERMGLRTVHSDMDRMRGLLAALGEEYRQELDQVVQSVASISEQRRVQIKEKLLGRLSFQGMYDDVDAAVDAPSYLFWRQLYAAYPDARFILTVRDRETWVESAREFFRFFFQKLCGGIVPRDTEALHELTYGTAIPDRATWLAAFDRHVAAVQEVIPKDRLLVIDLEKEGGAAMQRVCSFVRPADARGVCNQFAMRPFPRLNVAVSSLQQSVDHRGTCFHRQHVRTPFATPQTAFVTVLSNNVLNDGSRHRQGSSAGYVYSTLVALRSLLNLGIIRRASDPLPSPTAQRDPGAAPLLPEFVVLTIGYLCDSDKLLLESAGARVLNFPAVPYPDFATSDDIPQSVESMAANNQKLHVFGLGHMYHTVIYVDADVIATTEDAGEAFSLMAAGFSETHDGPLDFIGCNGRWAPINGGWWVVRPSCELYERAYEVLQSGFWGADSGWMGVGPFPFWRDVDAALTEWTNGGRGNWSIPRSGQAALSDWSFFGSASDQGLLQYFFGSQGPGSAAPRLVSRRHAARTLIHTPPECPQRQSFCHFTGQHKPWLQLPSDAFASGKFWGQCTQRWHDVFNSLELAYPALWADKLDAVLVNSRNSDAEAAATEVAAALRPMRLRSGSLLRTLHVSLFKGASDAAIHESDSTTQLLLPWAYMQRQSSTGTLARAVEADMRGIHFDEAAGLVSHVSSLQNI